MQRLLPCAYAFAVTALGAFSPALPAQSAGGSYEIAPTSIAGGGATLSGGAFRLSGTIGQPATRMLSAAGYRLYDGFWAPASTPSSDLIFANGFDL